MVNLPIGMAHIISRGLASLHELQTIYGSEDFYNLLEIAAVDAHNIRLRNTPKN